MEEVKKEEDDRWRARMKKSGVDLLSKELGLTPDQERLIAPIVEEHLATIRSFWWSGASENKPTLSQEEKVRLSEQARSEVDNRIRLLLGGYQSQAYQEWATRWRQEAPKRSGDVGPLRWW